ncbi:hypothetical protein [Clostridium sp.]|uniref:hypothetical protein n=1 Tax=Clostridium sp. TaxID=1506 RepID=UPI002616AD58|nr:hypothetical protein [uncultured Clostridium sp.]
MKNSKMSSIGGLKISGCFIFDIAVILAFFKVYGLFFIIAPGKSIFMLGVLLVGIIIFNGVVIFPSMIFKNIGMPYLASTVTLLLLYVIIANVFSLFFITGSTVWYMVWELIIFAVLLIALSTISRFLKCEIENTMKIEKEKTDKSLVMLQLLKIEATLNKKEKEKSILSIINVFKILKERIQASTPFGRITENSAVLELEKQIKDNLVAVQAGLEVTLTDNMLSELKGLLEDTRTLVVNREILNIK